jgi:hypothetical protein
MTDPHPIYTQLVAERRPFDDPAEQDREVPETVGAGRAEEV